MLKKCKELFDLWNREKVLYCHWKGTEHLSEGLKGDSDLDILLSIQSKETGTKTLLESGFIKAVSQKGSRFPLVEDWIGFDDETGRLIHVHLYYKLRTGHIGIEEYLLPWENIILEERKQEQNTGIYVIDPNYELIILFIRMALKLTMKELRLAKEDRYDISAKNCREVIFLRERTNKDKIDKILNEWFDIEGNSLTEIVQEREINGKNLYSFYTVLKSCSVLFRSKIVNYIRSFYYYMFIHIRYTLRTHCNILLLTKKRVIIPAISIAFIGQDGSGKSTVTEEIRKWLFWKIECERFYLGSGDHCRTILKRLSESLSKKRNERRCLYLPSKCVSMLFQLSLAKNALAILRRANKYKNKGGIPLFDRYPQNQFYGIYDGPRIKSLSDNGNSLLRKIINVCDKIEGFYFARIEKFSPTLVFKLLLPAEESLRRKPDHDRKEIERKEEITKCLNIKGAETFEIDATQSYEKEILQIKSIIWRYIFEKNAEING